MTQQCRMVTWGEAEVADDTRANELGLNHPVHEQRIEAEIPKTKRTSKTVPIMKTMIAAKIDTIERSNMIAAGVQKIPRARVGPGKIMRRRTSVRLWCTTRKSMDKTIRDGGEHHPVEEWGNHRGGSAICCSPSRNTGGNMTDAGSVMGRISHIKTIIRRARSTRRPRKLISKPTPRRCPERSV